jgi:hypothetical protein
MDDYFYLISSVQISSNDRIYILDSGNYRVVVFDGNGDYLFEFGGRGAGPGEFTQAWAMVLDDEGNVYVSDVDRNRIIKYDADGDYLETITNIGTSLSDLHDNHVLLSSITMEKFGLRGSVVDLTNMQETSTLEYIHTYDQSITRGGMGVGERYQFLPDGDICLVVHHPYQIRRYSIDGELKSRISKEESRVKPPDIQIYPTGIGITSRGSVGPCLMTDSGMILIGVQWFLTDVGSVQKGAIDFFSDEGRYLGSVDLPDYHKLIAIDSLNRLYAVQSEPTERVVRYRWKAKE